MAEHMKKKKKVDKFKTWSETFSSMQNRMDCKPVHLVFLVEFVEAYTLPWTMQDSKLITFKICNFIEQDLSVL